MARFRRSRRSSRRVSRRVGRRGRSYKSGGSIMNHALYGGIYGASMQVIDPLIVAKITPYVGMLGQYAPNAARLGVLWGATKITRNPTVNKAAISGATVEGAEIGRKLAAGLNLGGLVGAGSSTSTQQVFG